MNSRSWHNEQTDNLCKAFMSLPDVESIYAFLEDIATVREIKSMAQRLEVAKLLTQYKTYPEIVKSTGASTATISRVKRSLDYGSGGYRTVLNELNESEK